MKVQMNIIYVSTLCSERLLSYLFNTSHKTPSQAVQKFHRLLVEGLAMQNQIIVETLSSIPVTSKSHKKRFWLVSQEKVKNVLYKYSPVINLPVIKNLFVFIYSFFKVLLWNLGRKNDEKVVICDILNFSISTGAFFACQLLRIKVLAVITDLPSLLVTDSNNKRSFSESFYIQFLSFIISNFDGYVLLTEQMNEVVNTKKRPYLVMEGLVNIEMKASENELTKKYAKKILLYAGGIFERYGIKKLIRAFINLINSDLELHIYGDGEMAKEMANYMKLDSRIKYKGICPNQYVVEEQLKATLLLNPRPSNEEFTKFSFPSKNMEYMASGTPLITTALPGMPKEYYDFVYIFGDESEEGIYSTLQTILSKPKEELHCNGIRAKEFVLEKKNNFVQAERLINFIREF